MTPNQLVTLMAVAVGHYTESHAFYRSPTQDHDLDVLHRAGLITLHPVATEHVGFRPAELTARGSDFFALLRDAIGPTVAVDLSHVADAVALAASVDAAEGVEELALGAMPNGNPQLDGAFYQVLNGAIARGSPSEACMARPAERALPSLKAAESRAICLAQDVPGTTFFVMRAVRAVRVDLKPVDVRSL